MRLGNRGEHFFCLGLGRRLHSPTFLALILWLGLFFVSFIFRY